MKKIVVFIDKQKFELSDGVQTGRSLKELAGIPLTDVLFLKRPHEDQVIANDSTVTLENGAHLYVQPAADYGGGPRTIVGFIDKRKFELSDPAQTGRSLKELAGIPLTDVLFLKRPHEDQVIANDSTVTLENGAHLYAQPPADYGALVVDPDALGTSSEFKLLLQPDGWRFLVIEGYAIPPPYEPSLVRLLVKLPPLFPDANPDMFWVQPAVRIKGGGVPKGTTIETILGEQWQRFSWHLKPGAWKPGASELRDYMRCIRARFERRD